MPEPTVLSSSKCFDGFQKFFSHYSDVLQCKMNYGIYLPLESLSNPEKKFPVLFYLSGLTCTETNFVEKSGFQRYASENSIIVVNPDTSPRGCNIEGEAESWDFGVGAGFYVDATEPKWSKNFRMYSYVCSELPIHITKYFNADFDKMGITGHSMGGHGALICAMKNPATFRSVSAFAPICNPVACPWGQKALGGYLGTDQSSWLQYDSVHLMQNYSGPVLDILIDQGDSDKFLKDELLTDNLLRADKNKNVQLTIRYHKGYDHSYFFVASFIGEHFAHHAKILKSL